MLKRPAAAVKRKKKAAASKKRTSATKKVAYAENQLKRRSVVYELLVEHQINIDMRVVRMFSTSGGDNTYTYSTACTWCPPPSMPRPATGGVAVWRATVSPVDREDADWACGNIEHIQFKRWMSPAEYNAVRSMDIGY